jgi:hypothetical protein
MLLHMVGDQLERFGSPSRCWCYRDEDYVGVVKLVAAKTKDPRTLEQRVHDKLMLMAGLEALAVDLGEAV